MILFLFQSTAEPVGHLAPVITASSGTATPQEFTGRKLLKLYKEWSCKRYKPEVRSP
jgi:hypothetical protein